jgi:hypothetical protein
MGAGASFNIKCPVPFVSTDALSCVMQCPLDKKFVRQGVSGSYACVYSPNPQVSVPLVTVGSVPFDGTTLAELQAVNPQKHTEFLAERQRVEQALATAYANIDSQQKLADAFKDLQAAENARAESPQAYQTARTAYYTLLKGPAWMTEEKARIAAADVAPEVARYRDAVASVTTRTQEQQKTIDIVNGIKDKVLSLKDDVKYSVNTFSDQLEKVKTQIAMETRARPQTPDSSWDWIDVVLNALLVGVLLVAIVAIVRQMQSAPATPTYTRPIV